MYLIDGTLIKLTTGDSFYGKVNMYERNGTVYVPSEGDSVRFAVKRSYNKRDCVLIKQIPTDTLILHLLPSETKNLTQKYVYDIELTKANGDVDTFISGELEMLPEVY